MRILVTGGAGFIGSFTTLELLKKGFSVDIVDSLEKGSQKTIDKLRDILLSKKINNNRLLFHKGDIGEYKFISKVFEKAIHQNNPIKLVIHLAGLKSVEESNKNPALYWKSNFDKTKILLGAMKEYKCKKIIFSSSATVYGDSYQESLRESFDLNPISVYGKTKLAVEDFLKNLYLDDQGSNEWSIVILRYFNPIGAYEDGSLGELFDINAANLFPQICRAALDKNSVVNIFGNDWETNDGTPIRDYIHIIDLAYVHTIISRFLVENKNIFKIFNIGTGVGTTVLELIKTFESVNKTKIRYKFSGKRKGDAKILLANSDLFYDTFSWRPKRDIYNMCKDGWLWVLRNKSFFEN
jgi:UDP-glucose 4-epimerase